MKHPHIHIANQIKHADMLLPVWHNGKSVGIFMKSRKLITSLNKHRLSSSQHVPMILYIS